MLLLANSKHLLCIFHRIETFSKHLMSMKYNFHLHMHFSHS